MLENLARVWERPEPPQQQEEMGFFTDTTLCIGCKACEVACKQWNQLPADGFHWTGNSYDNTTMLSDTTWRHVAFVEQLGHEVKRDRWLMMSDVCEHCVQACPFGVLDRNEADGCAHKCTLCYDRQKDGLTPACAKACPTESIKFGPITKLHQIARARVEQLHERGEQGAYLYGADAAGEYSALNSFFLLLDKPSVYNLPEAPRRPAARMKTNYLVSFATAIGLAVASALMFARRE